MEIGSKLAELQKAANYRWLWKTLRTGGVGSIVFGTLALLSGLGGAGTNIMSTGLASLGVMLLAVGLWAVVLPSPLGVIFDGSVLMVLGFWNILSSTFKTTPGLLRAFIILGMLQILWGVNRFSRFKSLAILQISKPPKNLLRWMDNLALLIFSAKPFEFGDVIAMQTDSNGPKTIWKALISGETAVFIEGFGDRMLFAKKEDINLHRLDTSTSSELARILVNVNGVTFIAVTPVQHLDRFEIWHRSLNEGDWAGFSGMKLAESVDWEAVR